MCFRSSDLWLASSACSNESCGEVPRYNASSSLTTTDMAESFAIRYGQGSATGELFQDQVYLAGRNISQGFGVCDIVSDNLLSPNVSGLMGASFPLNISPRTYSSRFQA